ncbi:MAG: transketolase [Clostridiales bacterium]|jgi:transketolase|nr:transketolase [Clostridiales bacterium]
MNQEKLKFLKETAKDVRKKILLEIYSAQSGHPGGSLSCADVLTFLYMEVLNIDSQNPLDPFRDRFVLSKGHASSALYAILSIKNFLPQHILKDFRQCSSILQGHPDMKRTPGVDMSTGSLGQGVSAANGIALAGKIDKMDFRVYVLIGDGELQEGQVWEAAMFASHYKLDNITYIIDLNGLQIDGKTEEIMNISPIEQKFASFGFKTIEIDAHDFLEIETGLNQVKLIKKKPTVVIAKSIKGKGVSFMENNPNWHGTAPNSEQFEKAIRELEEKYV